MGYEFENHHQPQQSKPFNWWLWIPLGLVAIFLAYAFISASTPEGQARIQRDMAIELCWERHYSKSLTPGEKRFIAGACEKMEADAKSGR
jgi:hypothetical protein